MSLDINLYKARLEAYGANSNNQADFVNSAIYENFESLSAYREVFYNDDTIGVHFFTKQDRDNFTEMYMIAKPPHKIYVGEYIYEDDDSIWLCYKVETYPERRSYVALCNNILTFQDSETLAIHTLPCMLADKTSVYYDGIHKNRLFMLSDDQIRVTVPNNDISKKIIHTIGQINGSTGDIENGKRLIFNHDKNAIYKMTRVNTLTDKGLIHIVMSHNTYDANTDNLELNIADYKEPNGNVEPPIQVGDYKIIIDGYDSIMFGTMEPYTVKVYEDDVGVDKELKFEIIGDETLIWIENIGSNWCTLKATRDRRFESVVLRVSLVEDETVYAEMEISAVAL